MKALSVLNPWAWLLATGAKRFETRCWATDFRGRFAIHASKQFGKKFQELCFEEFFDSAVFGSGGFMENPVMTKLDAIRASCGCVLAVGELVDCQPVEAVRSTLSEMERAFGDYSSCRFAWRVENVQVLPRPIAAVALWGCGIGWIVAVW